jgi:hypothetical protein
VTREVSAWSNGSLGHARESRRFDVRFFNDRDLNIALCDVQVEYCQEGEVIDTITPHRAGARAALVEQIDLESRKTVNMELELTAEGVELVQLKNADEISSWLR